MAGLPKPPTIDDKALAAVDGEWRTARAIYKIIGEEAHTTARLALTRLAGAGKIERRYEPHQTGRIAFYRLRSRIFADA